MRKTIILCVLLLVLACSSCDKKMSLNDYTENINSSMATVKIITNHVMAHDTDVLVYEYDNNTMFLEDGGVEITKTIKSLGSNFELETKTTKETLASFDRNKIFSFNFNENLLSNVTLKENGLTFEVLPENVKEVFCLETLSIKNNASCEFVFIDKKLTSVKVSFVTASNKNVEVNINYQY